MSGLRRLRRNVEVNRSGTGNNQLDLAFRNQLYLANYQLKQEERARTIVAADKVAEEEAANLINGYSDWDLGCAVLVLHRRYGKDAYECVEFLNEMQNLTKEFADDGLSFKDVWNVVREEVGVDIQKDY